MATRSSPITVGREGELATIDEAREQAAEGRPGLILVRGEAGIGKSRLVMDAMDRARADGSPILHGTCLDLEGEGLPYLPVVTAFRNLVRSMPRRRAIEIFGNAIPELGRLVPEIAALGRPEGVPTTAPSDGADAGMRAEPAEASVDRSRLFERFLGVLERLGAEAPVIAVIEDVQWIDPATHDLVTFLTRYITTEHVVAILTCRTDDLPPGHPVLAWLGELARAPGAIRIELGRLNASDLERQLGAIHDGPVPHELLWSIWKRSEGHPMFAEELLANVTDRAAEEVPASLVDLLLTRIAGLDDPALAVVRGLAVAGRPVDERLLEPVVGRDGGEVGSALRDAISRGVLTSLPDGRHGFRHELLREIVERDLTAGERRHLHEAFARELERQPDLADRRPAAATAELARHWSGADRPAEAYRAARTAAAAAESVNAFADAHRQLERAMALEDRLPVDERPDDAERIETRRRAALVADLGGAYDRAVVLTEEALALARRANDPLVVGPLHSRLGFLKWAGGDGEAALVEHRRAVDIVPAEPATVERAAVLAGLGGALMGLGRWAESRPICEAAIACATSSGAVSEESRARTMLGSDLVSLGELAAGLDELREAHRLAGAERTELSVVTGHNLALNLLATDHLEEALEVAMETRASASAGGLERRYGMELAALVGDILMRLGRWDAADTATAEGLALDQRALGTAYLAVVRARLMARRGDLDDAERRLGLIERDRLEPDLAVFHAIVSAETALLAGRPADALEDVGSALDAFIGSGDMLWGVPLVALGMRAAAERAEALRASRDAASLASLEPEVARLRALIEDLGGRIETNSGRAWLASARAETARLDAAPDATAWRAAVDAWGAAGDPAEIAYARYRLAETELRLAGVKADVADDLLAAWRTAARLRAAWLRGEIEVLARRARIALPDEPDEVATVTASDDGRDGATELDPAAARSRTDGHRTAAPAHTLSSREVEVLRLVAAGRSNGEIGDELFISRKTAGVHVTHILNKLGVSNRVEAAMAAARLGLLDGSEDGGVG